MPPGQTLQIIARYQSGTLAAAGTGDSGAATVTLPTNFDDPNGASGTTSTDDDYYVGWTIETELPTGRGIVTDYHGTNKVATIEWETIVTDVTKYVKTVWLPVTNVTNVTVTSDVARRR